MKPAPAPRLRRLLACTAVLLVPVGAWLFLRPVAPAPADAPATPHVAVSARPAPPSTGTPPPAALARPLPVAHETPRHAWSGDDAMSLDVIQRLALHPEARDRMIEENTRIKRRQLVYRKAPVALLLAQARASGRPLTHLTLPAMDGREVEVEVLETQIDGHRGAIMGRLVGRPDSVAAIGFSGACESFNILSPSDDLYLTAEAREPGELFLKEIDPATYSPLACGGPLTAQK